MFSGRSSCCTFDFWHRISPGAFYISPTGRKRNCAPYPPRYSIQLYVIYRSCNNFQEVTIAYQVTFSASSSPYRSFVGNFKSVRIRILLPLALLFFPVTYSQNECIHFQKFWFWSWFCSDEVRTVYQKVKAVNRDDVNRWMKRIVEVDAGRAFQ